MECFEGKSASLGYDARTGIFTLGQLVRVAAGADIVVNGLFASDTGWTKGTGWTIASDKATHAAGTGADLSQDILTDGSVYRITYTVSGQTAGTLTAKAGTGGAGVPVTENGTYKEYLTCTTSTLLIFAADDDFDGSVSIVVAYRVAVATIVGIDAPGDGLAGTLQLNGLDTAVLDGGLIEDTSIGVATADGVLKNHVGNWGRLQVAQTLKFAPSGLKVDGVTVTGIDAPSFPAGYNILGAITEVQLASGSLIAYDD